MSEQSFLSAWRAQPLARRGFLRVSAASAATVALVAATGCSTTTPQPVLADPHQLPLPIEDQGILYYVHLLALAQATVYQKVMDTPPTDLTPAERTIFASMRDHAVIHRELFKYAINPAAGNSSLFPADFAFKLTSFTLTTRAGVLAAAQQLADLVAAAYPAVQPLVANVQLRALLLKVASVVARHSATLHDLIAPGSFASDDVVESSGLLAGQALTKTPTEVLAVLAPFVAPYVFSIACVANKGGLCRA